MSFQDFAGYVPVHSTNYPTYTLEVQLDASNEQQILRIDTVDQFNALWSELLYLNRSPHAVSIITDPRQAPFYVPAQSLATLEGWGRTIQITSGSSGFGAESNLRLTLARREDIID